MRTCYICGKEIDENVDCEEIENHLTQDYMPVKSLSFPSDPGTKRYYCREHLRTLLVSAEYFSNNFPYSVSPLKAREQLGYEPKECIQLNTQ